MCSLVDACTCPCWGVKPAILDYSIRETCRKVASTIEIYFSEGSFHFRGSCYPNSPLLLRVSFLKTRTFSCIQNNYQQEINIDNILPTNPQTQFKFCQLSNNVFYSKKLQFIIKHCIKLSCLFSLLQSAIAI